MKARKNFSDLALLSLQSAPIPRKGKRPSLNLGDDTNFFAQSECAPLSSIIRRGVQRTVTHLLQRYEKLVAVHLADRQRLHERFKEQGQVILALDGLQPDVGHEVLWVLRDCLSGEILLARSLLSACETDLASLLREVQEAHNVPIRGVISDGQHSIRKAVQTVLPDVPHQLCHFHYLREAAKPVYEADRHAKKELKKQVRGIRPIERAVEKRNDAEAEVIRGYCLAVRSALTDDGRPPLEAPGLKLRDRLATIVASLTRVSEKGVYRVSYNACRFS